MGRPDEPLKEHRESKRVVRPIRNYRDGNVVQYMFMCPGCKRAHVFQTPKHKFNCDLEWPTVSPPVTTAHQGGVCQVELRDGLAHFENSCEHALRGQIAALEPF